MHLKRRECRKILSNQTSPKKISVQVYRVQHRQFVSTVASLFLRLAAPCVENCMLDKMAREYLSSLVLNHDIGRLHAELSVV